MDQGTGDCTQGQPTPLTDKVVVKLELPWSMEEEPQDQPSAVYSTVQPMSDNTSGPLLSLDSANHVCQRCSAVFTLSSSLDVHMETFHGETLQSESPVASRLHHSACEHSEENPSAQERVSTPVKDVPQEDSVMSSSDFVIKLEPPWSVKEEPQDQPSAVSSTAQPMSDNTSGPLLSLDMSHVCQRCSSTFVLFSSLELHMVTFHGEALHDVFPVHTALGVGYHHDSRTENVSSHNNQKALKKRENTDTDRTHQEKKPRKHVCGVCSKAFTKANHLNRHKVTHTGQKPFVCDECGKAFTQAGTLKRHQTIHTGIKPFVCDVCSKAFCYASRFKGHKLIHTGCRPFECDVCSKTFTTAGSLKTHKLTHTGLRSFVCNVCSKAFTLASTLRTHKLIHTSPKSFVCDECNAAFAKAGHLNMHKLIHKVDRPFVCDVCKMTFYQAGRLKQHKLIHTGIKPFVCDVCSKAFTRIGDLKMHKATHTGHKPFVCDVCTRAFSRATHLKRHKVVHTKA